MDKAEKKLAKKVLAFYKAPSSNDPGFSRDENLILERWRVHRIMNEDAFVNATTMGSNHKVYLQNLNYPFTSFGDEEIKKDWYLHFRSSKAIIIIRDMLTVIAFLVSLYVAISKIIQK